MKAVKYLLFSSFAVAVAAYVVPGVRVADIWTTVVVALVFAIINWTIKPVLLLLTLPITLVTLGLFSLVVNAALVMLVAYLVPGFTVDGWIAAGLFSIVVSIVGWFLNKK